MQAMLSLEMGTIDLNQNAEGASCNVLKLKCYESFKFANHLPFSCACIPSHKQKATFFYTIVHHSRSTRSVAFQRLCIVGSSNAVTRQGCIKSSVDTEYRSTVFESPSSRTNQQSQWTSPLQISSNGRSPCLPFHPTSLNISP